MSTELPRIPDLSGTEIERMQTNLLAEISRVDDTPSSVAFLHRPFALLGVAALAIGVSVGAAAAAGVFETKAKSDFAAPGNRINSGVADASKSVLKVSTSLPNGARVEYWEAPMIANGKITGACGTMVFSDPGITTTLPGKPARPGAGCHTGLHDIFNFTGTIDWWTSPVDGVTYEIDVLTVGNAKTVTYRFANGQVTEAKVENRRSIVVFPKSWTDKDFSFVAYDDKGRIVGEGKRQSSVGKPG